MNEQQQDVQIIAGGMLDIVVPQAWGWADGALPDGSRLHLLEVRGPQTCTRLILTDDALQQLVDQASQRLSGLKVARLVTP